MSADPAGPDTIVLIHGFWVTPRSWEHWIPHYEAKGYRVLAPAYPGFDVEVEALNADPAPVRALTVPAILARLDTLVRELPRPPILIGHSAGGVFTQILLDRGLGAAGVAINSAPTEGVLALPPSQLRATLPVFRNPLNRNRAVGLTLKQWRYAFTNTFSDAETEALYHRYAVPASGRILWSTVLANFKPGKQDAWVDYGNAQRAPLLFIGGGDDHLMPPAVQKANAKKYRTVPKPEVKIYPGKAHLLPAQAGWEEIADFALSWAEANARTPVSAA